MKCEHKVEAFGAALRWGAQHRCGHELEHINSRTILGNRWHIYRCQGRHHETRVFVRKEPPEECFPVEYLKALDDLIGGP